MGLFEGVKREEGIGGFGKPSIFNKTYKSEINELREHPFN